MADYSFLGPPFQRIEPFIGETRFRSLREPQPGSSLATEDRLLGGAWRTSIMLSCAMTAGVSHIYVFRRMVADLKLVGPIVPWTLLRSAMEDFATCVWLLYGSSRNDRLTRTLKTWAHDLWERGKYDEGIDWTHTGTGKTADLRREDLKAHAKQLGLAVDSVFGRWSIESVIRAAVTDIDHDANSAVAFWRVGSGFAHGRIWPNIRALEPTHAFPMTGELLVGLVLDDGKLKELADWCDLLLKFALERYELRSTRP